MDVYHIWFDLKPGTSDTQFVERVDQYLGHLVAQGKIQSFRVTRKRWRASPSSRTRSSTSRAAPEKWRGSTRP